MTIDYTAALILCFVGGVGASFILLVGLIRACLHVERRRLLEIEEKWRHNENVRQWANRAKEV